MQQSIVFFDGECALCDSFITRLIRSDKKDLYRFTPLQGETAKTLLGPAGEDRAAWSMAFQHEGRIYHRSDAVLRSLAGLGGVYRIWRILLVVPSPLRDRIYEIVSANRYKWFGKRASCRLPGPGETGKFLP